MEAPLTIHYHVTPITPMTALYELAGRHFLVSHANPGDINRVAAISQSFMLDNGAYSKYKSGKATDWNKYYAWCDEYLAWPVAWAVIPDVIDAGSQEQDALIREWPHGHRGAPVWHMDEPVHRLVRLTETWPKVCIGSTGEFWSVLSPAWEQRMDEAWNELAKAHQRTPWVHMLRGMQLSGKRWPFASLDSSDVAQNHHLPQHTPTKMANRWDGSQCPAKYQPVTARQMELS